MAAHPTPHSVALSALIALHCEENSPLYVGTSSDDFTAVDAFLQDCLLNRRRHWTQSHDTQVATLLEKLKVAVNLELKENFLEWLNVAASSIDAMTDLMMTIQRALQEGSVDSESANGMFLRSVCLGFDELAFESTVDLWEAFRTEVDFCGNLDGNDPVEHEWTLSPGQREAALREECLSLAVRPTSLGLEEFQSHLQQILNLNPELPSAHFLRFLSCLQSGERVGAVEALHQYMDYALIQEADRDEILQFAAILKAALHHASGDKRLSKAATEEAVRVAQQSQDAACVAFALGWLSVHASDPELARELMERCVQRAMEGNLRTLVAGANLSLAVAALQTQNPTRAWVHLNDAVADNPTADTSNPLDRPTHMTHLDSGDGALGIAARQQLVAAGIWQGFGQNTLSRLASVSALHCHQQRMTAPDMEVAVQNIARTVLYGSTPRDPSNESTVRLYEQFQSLQAGDLATSSAVCVYGVALQTLNAIRSELDLPWDRNLFVDVSLIVHEWAVRRGDLCHAGALITALKSKLHPLAHNYDDVCIDVASQHSLLLSRQGRAAEAKAELASAIQRCKAQNKLTRAAELLLQLAHLDANREQYTNALSPLMECFNLCKKHELDSLHAAALSVFALLLLRMGNCKRALGIVRAALPTLLQNGHVALQAEAYLTLSRCHLQIAKASGPEENQVRKSNLHSAIVALRQSEELFLKCQDCVRLKEVYFLLSRACDSSPEHKNQRNKYAESFIEVSTYLNGCNVSSNTEQFMHDLSRPDGVGILTSRTLPFVKVL